MKPIVSSLDTSFAARRQTMTPVTFVTSGKVHRTRHARTHFCRAVKFI